MPFQKGNIFGFKFKKGLIPWNKGTKGIMKSNSGCFKKGQLKTKGMYAFPKGENHPNWKGGRIKSPIGYVFILISNHPFCNSSGYVREHRLIVEQQIGRYLTPKEVVHHLGKKDDNRPHMLMAFVNGIFHFWFHKKGSCNSKGIIFDGRL